MTRPDAPRPSTQPSGLGPGPCVPGARAGGGRGGPGKGQRVAGAGWPHPGAAPCHLPRRPAGTDRGRTAAWGHTARSPARALGTQCGPRTQGWLFPSASPSRGATWALGHCGNREPSVPGSAPFWSAQKFPSNVFWNRAETRIPLKKQQNPRAGRQRCYGYGF